MHRAHLQNDLCFSFVWIDIKFCCPFILQISGTIGCIWYICWLIIVRRGPSEDKYISHDELRYIQESLGSNPNKRAAPVKHPWKDIFTSKAVYAICASHFAENWGFYTMLTQLPTFLAGIFNSSVEKSTISIIESIYRCTRI